MLRPLPRSQSYSVEFTLGEAYLLVEAIHTLLVYIKGSPEPARADLSATLVAIADRIRKAVSYESPSV